ncbi:uncharacterized protein COX7B [Eurosta solidaginis]|uniref:uncharacterized protein COX7B n=1 Tax=Eurosta solidaginis TaxID=178769 RepID=UPI00353105FB
MLVKRILKQGLLVKNAAAMSRAAYHGGHHQRLSMNDMPVPEGDWKEQYTRNNARYNAVLVSGILFLAGTIAFVRTTGIIDFNASPPETYE